MSVRFECLFIYFFLFISLGRAKRDADEKKRIAREAGEVPSNLKVKYDSLPSTHEEIDVLMKTAQTKADMNSFTDSRVVAEFERKMTSLQSLRTNIEGRKYEVCLQSHSTSFVGI